MCTKIFEFRKIVIDEPIMLIIGVLSVCDNLVKSVFNFKNGFKILCLRLSGFLKSMLIHGGENQCT